MHKKTPQSELSFEQKAAAYWTAERLKKFTHDKKLLLLPHEGAKLLRVMGLMNQDASISAQNTKKYLQINHLLNLILAQSKDLWTTSKPMQVFDLGAGNGPLSLLLAWYINKNKLLHIKIKGIDREESFIQQSQARVEQLGYQDILSYHQEDLKDLSPSPANTICLALHACDTATDEALAFAIKSEALMIAVAPCCQRELARSWDGRGKAPHHPLAPLWSTPQLRWDLAASMTDSLRMLLLRAKGYKVQVIEFTQGLHTPKNRLIIGRKHSSKDDSAFNAYTRLKDHVGAPALCLERRLEGQTD